MKEFLKYIKNRKTIMFFILLFLAFDVFATTVSPKIYGSIVDNGILVKNLDVIKSKGLTLFLISFSSIFINSLCAYLITKLSMDFGTHLSEKVFNKIQTLSFNDLGEFETSSIVNRAARDTKNIAVFFAEIVKNLLRVPFVMGFAIYFAYNISKKLTLAAFLIFPVVFLMIFIVGRIVHKITTKLNKEADHMNNLIKENIEGIKDVKIYSLEQEQLNNFDASNKKIKRYADKTVKSINFIIPVIIFAIELIIAYVLWLGVIEIKSGELEPGSLIALFMYLFQIIGMITIAAENFRGFFSVKSSIKRVNEILDLEEHMESPCGRYIEDIDKINLELKNVSLNINEKDILKDINLKINDGTSVGIIGNIGSSKTSLLNIILRVMKETNGEVLLNGININNYSEKAYLSKIGYMPQKLVMLSGTIKDNIKMGKSISDEEIIAALKIAEAKEFIDKYPDGIMHESVEGGKNFSGGQKQRINIARAIVRKPKILILDDATSAIDIKTEKRIWNNIKEELGDITKIVVSQRISSIKDMDMIVVMDNGQISNIGTHEELLGKDEIYTKINMVQNG